MSNAHLILCLFPAPGLPKTFFFLLQTILELGSADGAFCMSSDVLPEPAHVLSQTDTIAAMDFAVPQTVKTKPNVGNISASCLKVLQISFLSSANLAESLPCF